MPDEHDRHIGVLGPGALGEEVDVVDDLLDIVEDDALALGAPVPEVVDGIHGGAVGIERGGDVAVAVDVLTVAVHEDHDVARIGDIPGRGPQLTRVPGQREVAHGTPP